MNFRQMTDGDLGVVFDMAWKLKQFHKDNDKVTGFKYTQDRTFSDNEVVEYLKKGANILLAEDNNKVVGMCAWDVIERPGFKTTVDIRWLFVEEGSRGKGIGTKLLNETILQIRHLYPNSAGTYIGVAAFNDKALNLYKAVGFEPCTTRLFFKA